MLAEIITIGDEILIGQVVDTNSAWMAKQLNLAGIKVKQVTSVSDDADHIIEALQHAEKGQRSSSLPEVWGQQKTTSPSLR